MAASSTKTSPPGSGRSFAPSCRRGTCQTRSTRCRACRGRCPARSSRCRSGRSCWARRSPTRPPGAPPAHVELLFITVHQVYELWFQQLLYELGAGRDAMAAAQTWRARQLLRRAHVIERLLVSQIDVLETMTPQDFLEFRAALAPASGFQSVQFRELDVLSGAKDPHFVGRFRALTDAEQASLARPLAAPTLWA